jgi:uroporphyrinogen III methyltransferase/synthase
MSRRGKVHLVGAGPGDPSLVTLAALRALRRADVVVYDHLVERSLLEYARPGAELVFVGKHAPDPDGRGAGVLPQDEINAVLGEKALEGRRVVRLKGGDPFVFGRGGEEAEFLRGRGVAVEVIPGITSGHAVPAYAGIPVTHRDFASQVTFVTGHERDTEGGVPVDWEALAKVPGTLVVLMGVRQLRRNCEKLIAGGKPKETPAALVERGALPEQRVAVATLGTISEESGRAGIKSPAILVLGDVVRMRKILAWYEKKPLFGRTVVVTRHERGGPSLARRLWALGARPIPHPTILVRPLAESAALDAAAARLGGLDWIILTSANGVRFLFERMEALGLDARALGGAKIAAIGEKTALALKKRGFLPDLVPDTYTAEGLIDAFRREGSVKGKKVLLARAKKAREVLPQELRKMGADVEVVPVYETVPAPPPEAGVPWERVDAIAFTSSSTVTHLLAVYKDAPPWPREVLAACIGPVTAETARGHFKNILSAPVHTVPGLVRAMAEHFKGA